MRIILFISLTVMTLFGCSSPQPDSKYQEEIKHAYDYVHPIPRKSITNWKNARVEEYISDKEMLVHNRLTGEQINIIGVPTLKITFKTDEKDSGGQIVVFVDQKSKKVLGSVPRK
jgi:hypothetical protein